jgi:hypothetical protein
MKMHDEKSMMDLLFQGLSIVWQMGYWSYKEMIIEDTKGNQPYVREARIQLKEAINIADFNWKNYLHEHEFFQYMEDKTEQELIQDVKLMLWDVFYPNEVYSETLQDGLMEQTIALLKRYNAIGQDSAIESQVMLHELKAKNNQWADLSLYELLRMRKFKGLKKIGLQRKNGTDQWFFYLLPEENWNLEINPNDYWENI